ncbi:MAG: hypothetical protein LUD02_00575 [Tannerellaceae bacterium]|nr:hypothetical protein [Tannerellaceae bacterium]MCD8262821.1 hypothetical protein [Tannerellaceae bacterium]
MDPVTRKKSLILKLKKELENRGTVSSIIKDNEDYFIAFQTNGLIHLQHTPEKEIKYEIKTVGIHCGVFCLHKDNEQDIIWIGTDGQGVYLYTRDQFSIRSVTFEHLQYSIQKPVRALYLDESQNLWIGTKDDGILLMENYQPEGEMNKGSIQHLTISNSELISNSVYAFEKSRRNILWIGGDGPGLNYYSYREIKFKKYPPGRVWMYRVPCTSIVFVR